MIYLNICRWRQYSADADADVTAPSDTSENYQNFIQDHAKILISYDARFGCNRAVPEHLFELPKIFVKKFPDDNGKSPSVPQEHHITYCNIKYNGQISL